MGGDPPECAPNTPPGLRFWPDGQSVEQRPRIISSSALTASPRIFSRLRHSPTSRENSWLKRLELRTNNSKVVGSNPIGKIKGGRPGSDRSVFLGGPRCARPTRKTGGLAGPPPSIPTANRARRPHSWPSHLDLPDTDALAAARSRFVADAALRMHAAGHLKHVTAQIKVLHTAL